jgi:3-oxoadipate enol-lactonase
MSRPVVLVHGASGNAATWPLDVWGGAVALDLPGRGAAAAEVPLADVGALAAWLLAALRARGLEGAVVVGHSLGGAVALTAALRRPDALGGVVLVATSARLKVSPAILAAVDAATPEAPFRLDAAFGPATPRAVIDAYAAASAATPPATARADWAACDAFDVRAALRPLGLPALVVHGDADALTPAKHQVAFAEALGAARVAIAGAGHMLPWEAPEAVARAVRGWV